MRRFGLLHSIALAAVLAGCASSRQAATEEPDLGATKEALSGIGFIVYLSANESGSTWQERDNAAWAKAQAMHQRFPNKIALPDYPDDNNIYRGLNPRSRGYSFGFEPYEQDDLTTEEQSALVTPQPDDVDGRPWGWVDGI